MEIGIYYIEKKKRYMNKEMDERKMNQNQKHGESMENMV